MALLTDDEMEYFENKIFCNAAIDELEIKEVSSLSHSVPAATSGIALLSERPVLKLYT